MLMAEFINQDISIIFMPQLRNFDIRKYLRNQYEGQYSTLSA